MNKQKKVPIAAIILLFLLIILFFLVTLAKHTSLFDSLFQNETTTEKTADTTPPIIICDIQNKTITPGNSISIEKLGIRVEDASEIESIAFTKISSDNFYTGLPEEETTQMKEAYKNGIEMFGTEFQFSYGGTYTLTITACDIYKNSSEITLTLNVEIPPVIETVSDYYVAKGSEIDFSRYVTAWDLKDSNFSFENLTTDTSDMNIGAVGNYKVTFTGTDSYGLTSSKTASVHILSREDLQELIDTQKINISDHAIIGAYNPYDIGAYEDTTLLEEAILPALVQITNEKKDLVGDGFIIKIDDEFITIATNESIVSDSLTVPVSFFDETACSASVVFTNTEYNLAFIQIPIDGTDANSSVSSDYVSNLRTVHLDETQWKQHKVTSKVSLEQLLRHYELVFKHKLQHN